MSCECPYSAPAAPAISYGFGLAMHCKDMDNALATIKDNKDAGKHAPYLLKQENRERSEYF